MISRKPESYWNDLIIKEKEKKNKEKEKKESRDQIDLEGEDESPVPEDSNVSPKQSS